jgi:hypothetical protein
MPVFKPLAQRETCKHLQRFQCASETIKNLVTDEVKSTTYHQCKVCGHIEGRTVIDRLSSDCSV